MFIATTSAAFAADDPMQSLFLFQQQMAEKGNASAMLKMGEMYERGEGVEKSYDNALKMYKKANEVGDTKAKSKAKVAIQRLENSKNKFSTNTKQIAEDKIKQRALEAEKLQQQREAAAAQNKARAELNAANNKALEEKLNKEKEAKAAAEKAKLEKEAKEKAAKAKAIKEAKDKAAKAEKAEKEKAAKANSEREAKAKAAQEAAKAKAVRIEAEKKRQETNNPQEGFKSDPCKGKAARLLSICR